MLKNKTKRELEDVFYIIEEKLLQKYYNNKEIIFFEDSCLKNEFLKYFQTIILVESDKNIRIDRIIKRDNINQSNIPFFKEEDYSEIKKMNNCIIIKNNSITKFIQEFKHIMR